MLEARGLSVRRGAFALRDVGFRLGSGEVLGLVGPNGSGKTTLFEAVAGWLRLDAGQLHWQGARLAQGARRPLFYLPDGLSPWPTRCLRNVTDLACDLFSASRSRGTHLLERLGLEAMLRHPLGALSKGERKRALLAFALLSPQPLLLLDEPFDGLDFRQTREAMAVLREEAATGRGLFLSIHQLQDAARACDRLVLLESGRALAEGRLEDLLAQSGATTLEEAFLALD